MGNEFEVKLHKPESTKLFKTNIVNKRIAKDCWIHDYNYKGQLLKATLLDVAGKPISIYMYEYDEKGNEVKHIIDDKADGKPDYINTNEYDDKDRLIRTTNDYDADGNIDNFKSYEYYDNGGKREEIRYTAQHDNFNDEFKVLKYDEKGRCIMNVNILDPLKQGHIDLFSHPDK